MVRVGLSTMRKLSGIAKSASKIEHVADVKHFTMQGYFACTWFCANIRTNLVLRRDNNYLLLVCR